MVTALACYLLTSYRGLPEPGQVLPLYLIALAVQFLHFTDCWRVQNKGGGNRMYTIGQFSSLSFGKLWSAVMATGLTVEGPVMARYFDEDFNPQGKSWRRNRSERWLILTPTELAQAVLVKNLRPRYDATKEPAALVAEVVQGVLRGEGKKTV